MPSMSRYIVLITTYTVRQLLAVWLLTAFLVAMTLNHKVSRCRVSNTSCRRVTHTVARSTSMPALGKDPGAQGESSDKG